MSGIDEVLSEVSNVNRVVTNSEYFRKQFKVPDDISDSKIAQYLLDIFWEFYTSFSGCPTIEDTQEWINERTERKIEK